MDHDGGTFQPFLDLQGAADAVSTILTVASSNESNSWQTALWMLFGDVPQHLNLIEPVETVMQMMDTVIPKWVLNARGYGLGMFGLALLLILCYLAYDRTERICKFVKRHVDGVYDKFLSLAYGVKSGLKTWANAQ